MGTSLTGKTIASSYSGLIKTTDNGTLNGSAKVLTDGTGTNSALYLSTTQVGIGINPTQALHISGNMRLTGAIYDSNNSTGTSGQVLTSTGSATDWMDNAGGDISGTGTSGTLTKFTGTKTIGDSIMTESGTEITLTGSLALSSYITLDNNKGIKGKNTSGTAISLIRMDSNDDVSIDFQSQGTSFGGNISLITDKKIYLGSSNESEIYHTASSFRIKTDNSSNLRIDSGSNIQLRTANNDVSASNENILGYHNNNNWFTISGADPTPVGSGAGQTGYDLHISNIAVDKDIIFQGNDNGTLVTAMTLDMSEGGKVKFNAYGSGTVSGTEAYRLGVDSSGNVIEITDGGGTITGSGTIGTIPKFTGTSALGDSPITISSSDATFAGKIITTAIQPSYDTNYYNVDSTISVYSASNYMYVNGIGGASGQGLRLNSEGAATNMIGLENSNNSIIFHTDSGLTLTLNSDHSATFAGTTIAGGGGAYSYLNPIITASDSSADAPKSIVINNQYNGSSAEAKMVFATYGNSWHIGMGSNTHTYENDLTFTTDASTSNSPKLRISTAGNATFAGNVGINGALTSNIACTITGNSGYEDIMYINAAGTNINSRINLIPTGTGSGAINSASNNLLLQTSGTAALTLDSDQDASFAGSATFGDFVRINGTTTTGLIIASAAGSSNGLKLYNNSATDNAYIYNHFSGNLEIGTNNATVLTMNGTTSTFAGNVDVGGGVVVDPILRIDSASGGNPTLIFDASQANRGAGIKFYDNGSSTGGFIDYVHNGDKMNFGSGSAVNVTMTVGDQKVGIGTDDPDYTLHLLKSSGDTEMYINGQNGQSSLRMGLDLRNWQIKTAAAPYLWSLNYVGTDAALSNIITANVGGNVGIGTDSPNAKLEVKGNFKIERSSIAEASEITMEAGEFDIKAHSAYKMRFFTGGSEAMRIQSNRNVLIGTTGATNTRLKVVQDVASEWACQITNTAASAYGLAIDTSANTGVYSLAVYTNTGTGFYVKNDGNVGIGTQTPDNPLEVVGVISSADAGLQKSTFANVGNDLVLTANADATNVTANILFKSSGSGGSAVSEKMRITSAGNVGIGVTPNAPAGNIQLDVGDTGCGMTSRQNNELVLQANANYGTYAEAGKPATRLNLTNGGEFHFLNAPAGTAIGDTITFTERMRITSGGVVQCGSPASNAQSPAKLSSKVDGSAIEFGHTNNSDWYFGTLGTYSNGGYPFLSFSCWAESGADTFATKGVPANIIKQETDGSLSFNQLTSINSTGQTPTERMRITSTGKLYFNTTADATSSDAGLVFYPSGVNSYIINAVDTTGTWNHLQFINPNGTVGSIQTNGSATTFATSSDYRLKEDLQDFAGLDMVSKIPVYDFAWKVDSARSYGVMAHELQEVLPQAVTGEKDAEEMQGVDYSKIVPLLVKSIQELEARVKKLEKNK